MCKLFIGADTDLWNSRSKSLRIDGMATSVRMENFFWATLEEIACRDHMTVNQLIAKLYHESIDAEHDLGNFTSFLRVCCGRYHALMAAGDVSASMEEPLGTVAADDILARERDRRRSSTLPTAARAGQGLN